MLSRNRVLVALDVLAVLGAVVRVLSGLDLYPQEPPRLVAQREVRQVSSTWELRRLPPVTTSQGVGDEN